jgi:hypothetical protein
MPRHRRLGRPRPDASEPDDAPTMKIERRPPQPFLPAVDLGDPEADTTASLDEDGNDSGPDLEDWFDGDLDPWNAPTIQDDGVQRAHLDDAVPAVQVMPEDGVPTPSSDLWGRSLTSPSAADLELGADEVRDIELVEDSEPAPARTADTRFWADATDHDELFGLVVEAEEDSGDENVSADPDDWRSWREDRRDKVRWEFPLDSKRWRR